MFRRSLDHLDGIYVRAAVVVTFGSDVIEPRADGLALSVLTWP